MAALSVEHLLSWRGLYNSGDNLKNIDCFRWIPKHSSYFAFDNSNFATKHEIQHNISTNQMSRMKMLQLFILLTFTEFLPGMNITAA